MITLGHSTDICLTTTILISRGLMARGGVCCVGGANCSSVSMAERGWGACDCAVCDNISVLMGVECKGCVSWVWDNPWL